MLFVLCIYCFDIIIHGIIYIYVVCMYVHFIEAMDLAMELKTCSVELQLPLFKESTFSQVSAVHPPRGLNVEFFQWES